MSSSRPSRRLRAHSWFEQRIRPYQARFVSYFDEGGKRAVWVVHRRGGKDLTALHMTCRMAHRRVGTYWHVFPTFSQGRKAIWEGFTADGECILDLAFPSELVASRNETEMKIEFKCGSIWRLIGSDRIEVVGAGPVGVVFSEYAVAKPRAWDLIRPMMAENGGWVAFITTPRGQNHAWERYEEAKADPTAFCELHTLQDTLAFDPERTLAEARAQGMPENLIRQEYLCDWTAADVGSVFGDLLPQAQDFDHPNDGVYTSWDLGVSDATAIWFWRLNGDGGVDFIDHYEETGKHAQHFVDLIESKPYKYVRHYLPHDGRSRNWVTQVTPLDQLETRWTGKVEVLPQDSLANGIEAGRWLLQRGTRFHTRCADGVKALKFYHYEYDEDRQTLARLPLHDWSSHSADAFRYSASIVKLTGLIDRPREKPRAEQPLTTIVAADGTTRINRTFKDLASRVIGRGQRRTRV